MKLVEIAKDLRSAIGELTFGAPVTHVYNPLEYAWAPHKEYLARYGKRPKEVLLVGMNPGPFGMAQTGVPFGDVDLVRDWLGIEKPVGKPPQEHTKRPIDGFDCHRNEVSGQRMWGWAKERFHTPEHFFERFFIWNYCPLCFMEESGRNRTPDKLSADERKPLFDACDTALRQTIEYLRPRYAIGVGKFAEARIRTAAEEFDVVRGSVHHPSPASPVANRGWAELMENDLRELGVTLD